MVNCEHLDVTKDKHCHIASAIHNGNEVVTHVCYTCKRNRKAWEKFHNEDKGVMPRIDYYVSRNVTEE